jgi:hypothetical protein
VRVLTKLAIIRDVPTCQRTIKGEELDCGYAPRGVIWGSDFQM